MLEQHLEEVVERAAERAVERAVRRLLPTLEESPTRRGDDDLLKTREAAAIARVTVPTVQEWVRAGKLKRHGTGRILISRAELLAYLSRPAVNTHTAKSEPPQVLSLVDRAKALVSAGK